MDSKMKSFLVKKEGVGQEHTVGGEKKMLKMRDVGCI